MLEIKTRAMNAIWKTILRDLKIGLLQYYDILHLRIQFSFSPGNLYMSDIIDPYIEQGP